MNDKIKLESFDQWLKLSREEQLRTVFACPASWRRKQVQHLWGPEAYGYGFCTGIPSGVAWDEMVKVIFSGDCECFVTLKMKREYISQMNRVEYYKLVAPLNKPGEICGIDPRYADRLFSAFSSWRNTNFFRGKEYIFTVEKFDENTLRFIYCTERGDHGDEDGFGVEPAMWTSALFDLNGNIVELFRPGIIEHGDEF